MSITPKIIIISDLIVLNALFIIAFLKLLLPIISTAFPQKVTSNDHLTKKPRTLAGLFCTFKSAVIFFRSLLWSLYFFHRYTHISRRDSYRFVHLSWLYTPCMYTY